MENQFDNENENSVVNSFNKNIYEEKQRAFDEEQKINKEI